MNLREPLARYRIMAWVVGVMLIFVFLFLHVGHWSIVGYHTSTRVESVIGPIHGLLYIVYLATVLNLLVVYRLRLGYLVGMVVAGWCPFVSFAMERLVTRRLTSDAAGYTRRPTFESELEP